MKGYGLTVDTIKIAREFYCIIPEEAKTCMIYGMLPKEFMDLLENSIKERLLNLSLPNITIEEIKEYQITIKKEVINKIMHEISTELLKIATEEGLCIV